MTTKVKVIVFITMTLLVVALVSWLGEEHAAVARSFLRNLFRHIF